MKKLLFFIIIINVINTFAQTTYQLKELDSINKITKKQEFVKRYKSYIKHTIADLKRKPAKILEKRLTLMYEDFSNEIDKNIFIYDDRYLTFSNKILEEFKSNNPNIPTDTQIMIHKSPSLNAFCLPDGTFILNFGLFYWLKNENQIAGIMAHEISHKILEHSIKNQLNNINDQLSSKTKTQVNKIKSNRYNKSKKAFDIYKDKLYAIGNTRKQYEYQADSLGYILLKNTHYSNIDFIETLKLMEQYDTIKPQGVEQDIYRKLYNLPNQPFQDKWLETEDFSHYNYIEEKELLDKDSISTHPELDLRIKKLESLYPELKKSKSNIQPNKAFNNLVELSNYNIVNNLIDIEEYGLALYVNMLQISKKSSNTLHHKKLIGYCFYKIYEARKNYQLNRYVDQINIKYQSESYMQFLNFIWNLSLNEIKNIADYYNTL